MWFEELTGFREGERAEVLARIEEDGPWLVSRANGRRMRRGELTLPSLGELRRARSEAEPPGGRSTLAEVVADVQELHAGPASAGATFQVASQFNLLEMVGPSVTPDDGIDRYERDRTQGPACAIACGAGTIHRNYLTPVPIHGGPGGERGQTADRQLDGLADLAATLGLAVPMRNGYALLRREQLAWAADLLDGIAGPSRDELAGLLRVGVQADTEVTWRNAGHTVTQVFCSALPLAYAGGDPAAWEPLARLVLDAAYEATLAAAAVTAARTGNRSVYLTLLGAGAFGNPTAWVVDALERAVRLHPAGLDVQVVSYGRPSPALAPVLAPPPHWADALFSAAPAQWGLRGDPYLWADLHASLRRRPAPPGSADGLEAVLADELWRLAGIGLAGHPATATAPGPYDAVRVPRYPTSGMSGGHVSPGFWWDTAVPLLVERWAAGR